MNGPRALMPADCFPRRLKKFKVIGNNQVWVSSCGNELFTWDESHGGEVEVFSKRGTHLGVMNCKGVYIKDPVKGRKLNV